MMCETTVYFCCCVVTLTMTFFILGAQWTIQGQMDHVPYFKSTDKTHKFVTFGTKAELKTTNETEVVKITKTKKFTCSFETEEIENVLEIITLSAAATMYKFALKVWLL